MLEVRFEIPSLLLAALGAIAPHLTSIDPNVIAQVRDRAARAKANYDDIMRLVNAVKDVGKASFPDLDPLDTAIDITTAASGLGTEPVAPVALSGKISSMQDGIKGSGRD